MIQYGCPTCHVIPGVPGAVGKVGPSLDSLAQRSYVAGVLPNSPENLEHWIMHPQSVHPGTAMPEMGVTEADAERIAAFFQTER
jgi:cytochrome c2